MSTTRKRSREERKEIERKKKITAELTCKFDTDDDELMAAAASNVGQDPNPETSPTPTRMSDFIGN